MAPTTSSSGSVSLRFSGKPAKRGAAAPRIFAAFCALIRRAASRPLPSPNRTSTCTLSPSSAWRAMAPPHPSASSRPCGAMTRTVRATARSAVELVDRFGGVDDLVFGQVLVVRQGEHALALALGHGEGALLVAQLRRGPVVVQRGAVVPERLDAALGQVGLELVASVRLGDEHYVRVMLGRLLGRDVDRPLLDDLGVGRHVPAAPVDHALQALEPE